jgi:hypothetical protein
LYSSKYRIRQILGLSRFNQVVVVTDGEWIPIATSLNTGRNVASVRPTVLAIAKSSR